MLTIRMKHTNQQISLMVYKKIIDPRPLSVKWTKTKHYSERETDSKNYLDKANESTNNKKLNK